MSVPGYDLLTLFSPVSFPLDWVGVLWPQLSKVLKVAANRKQCRLSPESDA